MQRPLISVVLPVFNAERTISVALTSLLNQTYGRFEIIAVDDGSTDSSPQLLADLAAQDKRISKIRTANRGVAAALNTGLNAAKGDLVARMDADDISEPTRFEKQVAHLVHHEQCVAVGCRMTLIDHNGIPLRKQSRIPSGTSLRDRCKSFQYFPPSPPTIPHPTAMIRLAPLKAVGGYRRYFRFAEDRDLWWRLSRVGRIHCLPARLLRYRRHEQAVSRANPEHSVADALMSDLSAIARHFGLDDSEILEEYGSTRQPSATIQQYVRLIGEQYPVEDLATFRAVTRGYPLLAGYQDRSSVVRHSATQLLRHPFSRTHLRLFTAALSPR